jgi:hypothetical protein
MHQTYKILKLYKHRRLRMLWGLPLMKEEGWWLWHSVSSSSWAPPSGVGTSSSSVAGCSFGFSPSNSNRVTPFGTPIVCRCTRWISCIHKRWNNMMNTWTCTWLTARWYNKINTHWTSMCKALFKSFYWVSSYLFSKQEYTLTKL